MERPAHDAADAALPESAKKALGAFYTPAWAVDHMIGLLRPESLTGPILEPSGGDGAFANGLIKAGVNPSQIDVWDINPEVKSSLESLGVDVEIGDTLARTDASPRYSAVVGNPPYLNKQSDYIKANRSWLKKKYTAIGAGDTYSMFTWLTAQYLVPGGQLAFLISDTFLTLGIHRKFRAWLTTHMTIDGITLLPADTFPDATVNTAVLVITNSRPAIDHKVALVDARTVSTSQVATIAAVHVAQSVLRDAPGHVLTFDQPGRRCLELVTRFPAVIDHLDGGLGMFTTDNVRHLAVVTDNGVPRAPVKPGQRTIDANHVDGKTWRYYHKRGGENRWWKPAEHAVAWDAASRAQYTIPAHLTQITSTRAGIAVSGVAARLSARMFTTGAAWESNKVFGLFPKDPTAYPPEFFLALFNSATYADIAHALNHTVSLQVRDLRSFPMPQLTADQVARLAALGAAAVSWARAGGEGEPPQQADIDSLVAAGFASAPADKSTSPVYCE